MTALRHSHTLAKSPDVSTRADYDWRDQAACATDPEVFYPADDSRAASVVEAGRISAAKAICRACPVRVQCRNEADAIEGGLVSLNAVHGVWAGETPRERIQRRKGRVAA